MVQIGERPVEIALAAIGFATVGVGAEVFRVEPDQLAEIGDGPVVVVLAEIVRAAIEIRADEVLAPRAFRSDQRGAAGDALVAGDLAGKARGSGRHRGRGGSRESRHCREQGHQAHGRLCGAKADFNPLQSSHHPNSAPTVAANLKTASLVCPASGSVHVRRREVDGAAGPTAGSWRWMEKWCGDREDFWATHPVAVCRGVSDGCRPGWTALEAAPQNPATLPCKSY